MGELWPNLSRRGLLGGMASGVVASALPVGAASAREPDPGDETRPHMQTGLDNRMRSDRAWERFLAEQDPVWRRLPRIWYEGSFLGNGFLGSMVPPGQGGEPAHRPRGPAGQRERGRT